jgi:chromosome segregation ATPase
MDILGKEGEEAKQHVQEVSKEISNLQSHLNAVDAALQDYIDRTEQLMHEEVEAHRKEMEEIERFERHEEAKDQRNQGRIAGVEDDLEFVKKELLNVKKRQAEQEKKIQSIADSELLEVIGKVRKLINRTNKRFYDLQDSVEHLENRINELENDFVMEVNTREFDFERKVDQSEFDTEISDIEQELKKMRSSLSILAEDEDGHSGIWKKLN